MLQRRFVEVRQQFASHALQENIRLKARLGELRKRFSNADDQKTRLVRKSLNRTKVVETVINKDARVEQLKSQLRNLIEENNILCT